MLLEIVKNHTILLILHGLLTGLNFANFLLYSVKESVNVITWNQRENNKGKTVCNDIIILSESWSIQKSNSISHSYFGQTGSWDGAKTELAKVSSYRSRTHWTST